MLRVRCVLERRRWGDAREGFEPAPLDLAFSRADFLLPCAACCQLCPEAPHLVCNFWKTFLCIITTCVINFA